MSVRLNKSLIRLALGCVQPASPSDVTWFINRSITDGSGGLEADQVQRVLSEWAEIGDIMCVHKRHMLYALTKQGDSKLDVAERKLRDRTRLFLLKDLRSATLREPEDLGTEQADASSAVLFDPATQEDERPIGAAGSPRRARSAGRAYWPLLSKQLQVGSSSQSSGTRFRFLSFPSIARCAQACGYEQVPSKGIGLAEIALALGISPRLLGILLHRPERHYRAFQIPKASGGVREIRAPRAFMKITQYFVLDYLLAGLTVHRAATAYSRGCSIKKNAELHTRKRYVVNIDVSDFFGSLRPQFVYERLVAAGLSENTAAFVSRLSSYDGGLPQGAPTSAILSNICLFGVDEEISRFSSEQKTSYTRYADDITFSGDDLSALKRCVALAKNVLASIGLVLNEEKTRIFGPSSRQVVTSLTVNDHAQPSRIERRRLRAALHQARRDPASFAEQLSVLQGRASYMLSYGNDGRGTGALPVEYVRQAISALREFRARSQLQTKDL
jgi:hypothetical protein